ncbi:MAG: TonB family protein [Sphingomonadales bacterium]|nr:TonB family protein [Sphingomonadales bacterium]MDE2569184.1 TonB family protein [Sphingomonadales bacterium]
MRYALVATCVAVLTAPTSVAAQGAQPIRIEANRETVQDWSRNVSSALDRNLVYPRAIIGQAFEEGCASISFRVGEDGRPVGIVLMRSSGSARLDRAALRAVGSIKEIAPLPRGVSYASRIRANVLFAIDESSLVQMTRQVDREMAREVQRTGHVEEIALTVSPSAAAG